MLALFRSAIGRTGLLNGEAMHRIDAWRRIQRRAAELGMKVKIGCHTFRATGITAYLEAGGTLENAQMMGAHESPRTTKLTTGGATKLPSRRSSGLRSKTRVTTTSSSHPIKTLFRTYKPVLNRVWSARVSR
jgi:integrase